MEPSVDQEWGAGGGGGLKAASDWWRARAASEKGGERGRAKNGREGVGREGVEGEDPRQEGGAKGVTEGRREGRVFLCVLCVEGSLAVVQSQG